ncbi:hypothetical protein HN51_005864, partial [Arachis hypogaea]
MDSYPVYQASSNYNDPYEKASKGGVPQTNNPWPYLSTSNQTAGSTVSSTASSKVTFLERGT